MGRGRYTPNDDRSRSMNSQDVCGQAAMANEARQRGDDGDWDDDGYDDIQSEEVASEEPEVDDRSHWGVYRDEPEKPKPKPTMADLGFYGDWDWACKIARGNLKPKSKPK